MIVVKTPLTTPTRLKGIVDQVRFAEVSLKHTERKTLPVGGFLGLNVGREESSHTLELSGPRGFIGTWFPQCKTTTVNSRLADTSLLRTPQ